MTNQHRLTFWEILTRLRQRNVATIQARAFLANRVAKLTGGDSRRLAYRVKDAAIHQLLRLGEGRVLRLYGRPIGVKFRASGMLHLQISATTTMGHRDPERPTGMPGNHCGRSIPAMNAPPAVDWDNAAVQGSNSERKETA